MAPEKLRAAIARVRVEIRKHLDLGDIADADFELALADRILAAHEVIAKSAEKKKPVKCYLVARCLGRVCEGV